MAALSGLRRFAALRRNCLHNKRAFAGGVGMFALGTGLTALQTSSVRCDDKGKGFDMNTLKLPDWISAETLKPLGAGLSFGGISGFVAGYACKQLGKVVAVAVGSLYCIFQVAAYYDYVKINWKKIESDVMSTLDTNKDGKVNEKDAGIFLQNVMSVLSNEEKDGQAAKNAGAGGFVAMFLMGMKKG